MNNGVVSAAGPSLDEVLASTPCLWKGRQAGRGQAVLATGHARLDRHLPGGGWPRGAVTELIAAHPGLGEFSLLFPALAAAGREGRWLLLVDPPWIPYPAALHGHGLNLERLLLIRGGCDQSLWACEQALRSMPEGIVLAWPGDVRFAALRRLQLAAESRGATAFLFRPDAAAAAASPVALRLKLDSAANALSIRILKCRGQRPDEPVLLPIPLPIALPIALHGPHCGQAERHDRTLVAGDTAAATGTGLLYPGPARPTSRQDHPHRHH